ncbi:MAG: hypothetical protein QOC57_1248 [Ilumatobacteraceae bacterium]
MPTADRPCVDPLLPQTSTDDFRSKGTLLGSTSKGSDWIARSRYAGEHTTSAASAVLGRVAEYPQAVPFRQLIAITEP